MSDRPRFFDDLAGVAGGALSALSGLRDEAEAMMRARVDETIRKLDLVRRDELEAAHELAANARTAQEQHEARATAAHAAAELVHTAMQTRLAALESKLAEMEHRLAALTPPPPAQPQGGGGPGMIV